jgi:NitT/TauT family transport system permease protein/putative hydroxymethylpyrimidine transport system permease protein
LSALVLFVALLGVWQLYADLGGVDDFLLPSPTDVGAALWNDRGILWSDLLVTGQEVVLGILLAVAVALVLATAIHLFRPMRRAVYPLLIGSQTIPIPMVGILLVAWFGYDIFPKVVIVALVSFFPIVVTTVDGLGAVDPALRKLMRTLGASRWQTFWRVEAPSALPAIFSGAKIAVAVSVIGAVLAEITGSSAGLGHLVQHSLPLFETARAYAAVAVLSAFAVALFAALSLAERRLVPWAHRPSGASS